MEVTDQVQAPAALSHGTHWTRSWAVTRAGVNAVKGTKVALVLNKYHAMNTNSLLN